MTTCPVEVTRTEWNVVTFVLLYRRQHGMSPSMREIAHGCGLKSVQNVEKALHRLDKLGLVRLGSYNQARTMVVTETMVGLVPRIKRTRWDKSR